MRSSRHVLAAGHSLCCGSPHIDNANGRLKPSRLRRTSYCLGLFAFTVLAACDVRNAAAAPPSSSVPTVFAAESSNALGAASQWSTFVAILFGFLTVGVCCLRTRLRSNLAERAGAISHDCLFVGLYVTDVSVYRFRKLIRGMVGLLGTCIDAESWRRRVGCIDQLPLVCLKQLIQLACTPWAVWRRQVRRGLHWG